MQELPLNVMRLVPFAAVVVIAAALVACGGDDDGPKRTEISQVDAVIDVVEAQDKDQLRDLLQFTSQPCTEDTGAGGLPRCQGEPAGTNVDVFQANECEAAWLRADGVDPILDQVIALEPAVYAAFRTPEVFYLEGEYAVVFGGKETRVDEPGLKRYVAIGVEGDNGRITGIALGCGIDEPVHFLLPHANSGFDDWLIEPKE